MKVLGTCRVVDAFDAWGSHNTSWRVGRTITTPLDAVETVLTYYWLLAWRILRAEPVVCFRAEFAALDIPEIFTYRGVQLDEWAKSVEQDTVNRSGDDVRKMAAAPRAVVGPLVCTCDGDSSQPRPPYVVFDGWHRGAAWVLQGQAGKLYPISAMLIVTKRSLHMGQGAA